MGNRGVITTEERAIGVYMHWNGGKDFVRPLLMYCKMKGYRDPSNDSYGFARLCQVLGNFFQGNISVGIDVYPMLDIDNGDNGTYIIDNWKIIGREFFNGTEQSLYEPIEVLTEINNRMPEAEKLELDDIKMKYAQLTTEGY